LVVLRRLIRAQPITIQQSTINEVLLSALFSGFVKTRARIISYRHSARKDCQEGFMLRKMGAAVAGILCWSSIVMAQAVEETTGQQQPATKIETLDLRGVLNEDITIVDCGRASGSTQVRRVERRRRDSVWNGVLIGAGAGALAGYGLGKSLDSPSCPRASECGQGAIVGTVGGAFWGAIGGWITDALIRKREVIYDEPASK
jgi:hypothetical protein